MENPVVNFVVKMVKDPETGKYVRLTKNPDIAYILLEETHIRFGRRWRESKRRSAIVTGDTKGMEAWALEAAAQRHFVPGKIRVQEFLEGDQSPEFEMIKEEFLNKSLIENDQYEEAIAPYVKVAGTDGIELISDGQRILRFSFYDYDGVEEDVLVQHENRQEVKSFARERRDEIKRKLEEEAKLDAMLSSDEPEDNNSDDENTEKELVEANVDLDKKTDAKAEKKTK